MANAFVKPEVVANTALGLLTREIVVPRLVWRDGVGDFAGVKDDTITVHLPAYAKAKTRVLRSGTARTKSSLQQRSVDVKLDTDVYLDVPVTDEQMELDIKDFGKDIINPMIEGTGRTIEERVVATMQGATYANEFALDYADLKGTIAEARRLLNLAHVPAGNRTLLVGSNVDSELVQLDNLSKFNESNSTDALREAMIGRIYGFTVVTTPLLNPGEAFAFHGTAFPLVTRAPKVPAGAPWGASKSYGGFATRVVRVFDPNEVEDRVITDSWIGSNITTDFGSINATTGEFEPAEDLAEVGEAALFVRAVHLTDPDIV